MATILYKDGEEFRVPAKSVLGHLAAGYSLTKDGKTAKKTKKDTETAEEKKARLQKTLADKGITYHHATGVKKLGELLEAAIEAES